MKGTFNQAVLTMATIKSNMQRISTNNQNSLLSHRSPIIINQSPCVPYSIIPCQLLPHQSPTNSFLTNCHQFSMNSSPSPYDCPRTSLRIPHQHRPWRHSWRPSPWPKPRFAPQVAPPSWLRGLMLTMVMAKNPWRTSVG